jgi:signal transduction histidine kinase
MPSAIRYLFFLAGFLPVRESNAQLNRKDSLFNAIAKQKADSNAVYALYYYGEYFENENPDSADWYYRKGLQLAEKLAYKKGIASYSSYALVLLNNKGDYLEGLKVAQMALDLFEEGAGTERDLAVGHINIGNEWQYLGDLKQAAEAYLKGAAIAGSIKDQFLLRICYNNLASVFIELKDYHKVLEYSTKAYAIATQMKNDYARASSMINMAIGEAELNKNYLKAISLYDSIAAIGQRIEEPVLELDALNGRGEVYVKMKQLARAGYEYNKMLSAAQLAGQLPYKMFAAAGLALVAEQKKKYTEATEYIQLAISLADSTGALLEKKNYLGMAAGIAEKSGNLNLATGFYRQYNQLSDSLLNEQRQSDIRLEEARYNASRREQMIVLQQAQISRRNWQIGLLVISLLAASLMFFLWLNNLNKKRQLQQRQIEQLEQEKQLLSTQALLRGQEEERSRMAKDLHDGLGGMLSGIKLTLGAMKGNMVLTEENARLFTGALSKLDQTISEMRRVAHSMMPEALLRLGLGQALNDYCNGLSESSADLTINYQQFGLEERLPNDTEIVVYRIVQELLTNVVKHSEASEALVQLIRQENLLMLTVEDNGRGFSVENAQKSFGSGLNNIRSRVGYLNGSIDTKSEHGKGSSFHIEIPTNV